MFLNLRASTHLKKQVFSILARALNLRGLNFAYISENKVLTNISESTVLKSAANPELDIKKLLFVFRMNMSMLIHTLALNTEEDGLSFSLSFGFLSCWTAVTMTKCY